MKSNQDWLGEAGGNNQETGENSQEDHIRLPVGIEKDGVRYRNVVIEEMCGIDDHLLSGKKSAGNGAIGASLVLCRCIQEVEGLLPRKNNPEKMFDRQLARDMTQIDRDFVLSKIVMLGGKNDAVMSGECPRCSRLWSEEVSIHDLEVVEWPEDSPLHIEFELEVGSPEKNKETGEVVYHKEGILRFSRGKDTEYVAKLSESAEMMDAILSACITRLGTLEVIDPERVKRFKSRDRMALMSAIQRDFPGLRQWKEVRCQCGRDFDIQMDINAFFGGRRKSIKKP